LIFLIFYGLQTLLDVFLRIEGWYNHWHKRRISKLVQQSLLLCMCKSLC